MNSSPGSLFIRFGVLSYIQLAKLDIRGILEQTLDIHTASKCIEYSNVVNENAVFLFNSNYERL